jgi:2-polyprenyl-3-methyl-5-hydroxy-6-metoxy-1,4-benzoquinol methylase
MTRVVLPEILDTLPADSAAARHSRRDLRWFNRCMGNHPWWRRQLARTLRPGDRVLEVGAGEGHLRALAPAGTEWHALDLAAPPAGWKTSHWHQQDVRHFDRWADYTVVVGNLVFHHFEADELRALGAAVQRHAGAFLACEPARTRLAAHGLRLLCPLLGMHAVTRHDARVSIAAGFLDEELPQALGFSPERWSWHAGHAWLGAYRLVAHRRVHP